MSGVVGVVRLRHPVRCMPLWRLFDYIRFGIGCMIVLFDFNSLTLCTCTHVK